MDTRLQRAHLALAEAWNFSKIAGDVLDERTSILFHDYRIVMA